MKPNWFVAFPVPASDWLETVLATLPATCRPFQPTDVHMTLAFLGAMDPAQKDDVIAAMNQIKAAPFEVTLGQMLALPNPKRVSALSFALQDGKENAARLMGLHRDALYRAATARPDTRPPLPHITIARPIRKFKAEGQKDAREWAQQVKPPGLVILINQIALYTWADDRRFKQFKIIYQHRLSPLNEKSPEVIRAF